MRRSRAPTSSKACNLRTAKETEAAPMSRFSDSGPATRAALIVNISQYWSTLVNIGQH